MYLIHVDNIDEIGMENVRVECQPLMEKMGVSHELIQGLDGNPEDMKYIHLILRSGLRTSC